MENRDIDIAHIYHEETKRTYDSVYRSHHFLDWENQPRPYKQYTTLDPIPLPQTLPSSNMPTLTSLSQSVGAIATTSALSLTDLAYILFYAAGVTKRRMYPGMGEMLFRAAACTGALYHIELYLAVTDSPQLAAGLYHFGPLDFALRRLRAGDYRHPLAQASGYNPALHDAPAILIATDTIWRNSWKYRARAYRHSFWDTGTICANLLAATTALGMPSHLVAGFVDAEVNVLLDLDTEREVALVLVGIGSGASRPEPVPSVQPLQLGVAPLSPQELDYPAIRLMHNASSLRNSEEVAAWTQETPPIVSPPVTHTVFALSPDTEAQLPEAAIEDVIRRRGSTRTFAPQPLSLKQLSNVLVHCMSAIPADFVRPAETRLNDVYLIVHAVSGLPAGTYVYHAQEKTLELLQEGNFRHQAEMLALGQDRAADASVNIYFLCDLSLILAHCGNRGYRAAQLEAGVLAGRMYLAAYAQGFGATGLTFFDAEVIDFFSPHAADKSVMFLLALGHAVRRQS